MADTASPAAALSPQRFAPLAAPPVAEAQRSDKDLARVGEATPPPQQPTKRPLRVLFVSSSSGDGGADRLPVELARALRGSSRAEIAFACRAGQWTEARCQRLGIPAFPFNIRNSGDIGAARTLARIAAEQKIDILHVHARRDFMVVALARAILRRRMGKAAAPRLLLHSHLIRTLGEPVGIAGWFFQRTADAVIAVSGATETFLNEAHGLRPGFVRRIPNGVEKEAYATIDAPNDGGGGDARARHWRRDRRADWGIPDDALVVGMVGRLFQKGQTLLLAAASRLAPAYPNLRIVLVGPERDPDDDARLAALAERLRIGERVVLAGARDDVPACLAAFDVLAHLPRDEAFGLAIAEGMTAGLPVLATDAGGCREVLREAGSKGGGVLLPVGSVDALTDALDALLRSASERTKRGSEARRAAEPLCRDRQIARLLQLYTELTER